MTKWIIYVDKNGKKKLKISDESLKKRDEEKEKKNVEKIERVKRQEEYILYLLKILPKEICNENLIRRFFYRVDVRGENECWNWIGGRDKDGYGNFWFNNTNIKTHRFSYEQLKERIPDNKQVCHKCNNPSCVNPAHLIICTQKENLDYMFNLNRANKAVGERHGSSKLNKEQVNKIREEYSKGQTNYFNLAMKYNVSEQAVCDIIHNKHWKDDNYEIPNPRKERANKIRKEYNSSKVKMNDLAKKYKISIHTVGCIIRNENFTDENYKRIR